MAVEAEGARGPGPVRRDSVGSGGSSSVLARTQSCVPNRSGRTVHTFLTPTVLSHPRDPVMELVLFPALLQHPVHLHQGL